MDIAIAVVALVCAAVAVWIAQRGRATAREGATASRAALEEARSARKGLAAKSHGHPELTRVIGDASRLAKTVEEQAQQVSALVRQGKADRERIRGVEAASKRRADGGALPKLEARIATQEVAADQGAKAHSHLCGRVAKLERGLDALRKDVGKESDRVTALEKEDGKNDGAIRKIEGRIKGLQDNDTAFFQRAAKIEKLCGRLEKAVKTGADPKLGETLDAEIKEIAALKVAAKELRDGQREFGRWMRKVEAGRADRARKRKTAAGTINLKLSNNTIQIRALKESLAEIKKELESFEVVE